MSIEAMKQALEALEHLQPTALTSFYTIGNRDKAITSLRQAIEQAEKQEPVVFRNNETGEFCSGGFLRKDLGKWTPLYTHPPQRQWVGLTGDEKYKLYQSPLPLMALIETIEDKLKQKNT